MGDSVATSGKIALASDHAGYDMKEDLKAYVSAKGLEVVDLGPDAASRVDYPDYGRRMAEAIEADPSLRGIIICGSGIGISIAANRSPAVRAALCQSDLMAKLAREHNDANVLALGARLVGPSVAEACVDAFLETEFEGGRHQKRVEKLGDAV